MNAEEFTKAYPAGTPVMYKPIKGDAHVVRALIRSDAWELGSGHVVVKISGYPGGVSINCISPVEEIPYFGPVKKMQEIIAYLKENGESIGRAYASGDGLANEIVIMYKLIFNAQGPAEIGTMEELIEEHKRRNKKG